ncbi:MAG: NTP transferase domain-containing protein [Clostridiaceae bacterium]|jgi:hypothetical protein|nr:NTP transferase domain-containing protein [Clostridiaceae bacterium]
MKIIIQAGGKGTRLEHLTDNKPKCLVSVKNKPMIFHLFNKYPKAEFIIIGDCKYDVLEKYLRNFAKHVNYKLIKASGTGNICGIKEALRYINNDEEFLLIWSDLILSEQFKPENLEKGDYVGILEGSECSWSFQNGVLDKITSNKYGVAGCFFFKNKTGFENIPESGSFTLWLKNSGLTLKSMSMCGSKEVGTIEALKQFKDTENRCRPYNKMEFTGDRVIKTGLTEDGKKLIDREIVWYKKMVEYGFASIPKIYNFEPLTMEKIDGTNIFQADLTEKQKEIVTDNLINSVNKMHSYETKPSDKEDLVKEYYTKTIDRLESIKNVIPFANQDYIMINDILYKNPLHFKKQFKEAVEEKLLDTVFCPIHGDCTLTNTMIDKSNNIYFIDARGYFGKQKVFGDIRYDWAKLYYSMSGNFDRFNIKDFKLKITDSKIYFEIASNSWENLTPKVLENMQNCKVRDIKFIHAIIWLSLASHCWEDYDSMCLAFYNGVSLISEHL